MFDCTLKILF